MNLARTRSANPAQRARWRGFTLVELMAVLVIVGVLAVAAQPLNELLLRRAQETQLRTALRDLRNAIDEHRRLVEAGQLARGRDGSPYPASLAALADGLPLLDGQGKPAGERRIYLLRRVPRDPFADRALAAEDTWGQRSSASPPDAPRAGADVFDVSSRSELTALDRTRYRDW